MQNLKIILKWYAIGIIAALFFIVMLNITHDIMNNLTLLSPLRNILFIVKATSVLGAFFGIASYAMFANQNKN